MGGLSMVEAALGYRHSARLNKPFARALRDYPAVPPELVEALDTVEGDRWIPYSLSSAVWTRAMAATGDETFGLRAARAVRPGDFDVVEYAACSCGTLGEAILVVNRHIGLLREGADFSLETHGDYCTWKLDMKMKLPRVLNDWTVAVYGSLIRRLSGRLWKPVEVQVTHSAPADTREYQRSLRAPVRFDCPTNALVFERHWLDARIDGADAQLNDVMRRYARDLLQRLPRSDSFLSRVHTATAEALRQGQASTTEVAALLHISDRTLRRRLSEQHTNFTDILCRVRHALATEYLGQDLSVAEISDRLGFSQTAAFSRAFKRWTGLTPVEFRRRRVDRRM